MHVLNGVVRENCTNIWGSNKQETERPVQQRCNIHLQIVRYRLEQTLFHNILVISNNHKKLVMLMLHISHPSWCMSARAPSRMDDM
jgi:hypothetical protein